MPQHKSLPARTIRALALHPSIYKTPGPRLLSNRIGFGPFEQVVSHTCWSPAVPTSVCVESTIRDAMFRDYHCVLLADCTAEPIGSDFPRPTVRGVSAGHSDIVWIRQRVRTRHQGVAARDA